MVNKTVKTYNKVSQFWTMEPKAFLASRCSPAIIRQ
jgi:hypothetical protein